MTTVNFPLRALEPKDVPDAAVLVGRAMNADEQRYAESTFKEYFESRTHAIRDGRDLYVLEIDGRIVGMTGLHHYLWGPSENVWLSWFAVDPGCHGIGLGTQLMNATVDLARTKGFSKLFVETYSSPTFAKARSFYTARGFEQVGEIRNYMPDGTDMIVYCRNIEPPTAKGAET